MPKAKIDTVRDEVMATICGGLRHGEQEPLAKDHPIRTAKHAVRSSHRVGANQEALLNIGRILADEIEAICSNRVPQEMQVAQREFIRLRG
jgi:phosphoglycerate dehydrogenase-like enzyme